VVKRTFKSAFSDPSQRLIDNYQSPGNHWVIEFLLIA